MVLLSAGRLRNALCTISQVKKNTEPREADNNTHFSFANLHTQAQLDQGTLKEHTQLTNMGYLQK